MPNSNPAYVKSTAAGAADGTSWNNAFLTAAAATAADSAGDTIWLSQSHAESSGTAQTISLAGTASNPVKVLCGNDGSEPPTSLATTATITTTGSNNISITGSGIIDGLTFNVGTGTSSASINICNADQSFQLYNNCNINLLNTGVNGRINFGLTAGASESGAKLNNSWFKFSNASQGVTLNKCQTFMIGGGIAAGGTAITNFCPGSAIDAIKALFSGVDLSNLASNASLLPASVPASGEVTFINCKMPASWGGGLVAGAPINPMFRASMYNCDNAATNYRLWIETFAGYIKSETTLVKTGGASDGTTALSWKMTTNANATEIFPLVSDDMCVWGATTGSSKTITVDILHDSATPLTDAEVWLEIDYLGSASYPIGSALNDKRTTILTTPADQTTSTATWTTTGMTNPNKQKLEVTFTPQMVGIIYARLCLAKPSYTVYVDYDPVIG